MALLIFLIAIVLGLVRSPGGAEFATYAVGYGAFAVLSLLWVFGIEVRPLEAVVLLVGTPLAGALASGVARWRLSRRHPAEREAL